MIAIFARIWHIAAAGRKRRRSFQFLILALSRIAATSEQRATLHGELCRLASGISGGTGIRTCSFFLFEELGKARTPGESGWQDAKLIAFDYWLTGVHPALWLEQFATPARNDFFQFAYLNVLHVPADRRRCSVLAAQTGKRIGDDDVLRSGYAIGYASL